MGLVPGFSCGHVIFSFIKFFPFLFFEFRIYFILLASSCENSERQSCLVLFLKVQDVIYVDVKTQRKPNQI